MINFLKKCFGVEKINWRKDVRVQGYLDLMLTGLLVVSMGFQFYQTVGLISALGDLGEEVLNISLADPLVWLGVGILIAALQVLAAVRLINSTSPGQHPSDALGLLRYGRVGIILLTAIIVMVSVAIVKGLMIPISVVLVISRGIWVTSIQEFMRELEAAEEAAKVAGGERNLAPSHSQV